MRAQGTDRFARKAFHRVREVVLPVPGREMRAHMGRELDVFAHVEPIGSVIRKDVIRPFAGFTEGETAGVV